MFHLDITAATQYSLTGAGIKIWHCVFCTLELVRTLQRSTLRNEAGVTSAAMP
jgi:hypothetical protein